MSDSITIAYDRGTLSAQELQHAVDEALSELQDAEDLEEQAAAVGLSAADVRSLHVEIAESEAGIDPLLAFIVVHIAGGVLSAAGGAGATLAWKRIILPRVRRAKRSDAIGDERAADGGEGV